MHFESTIIDAATTAPRFTIAALAAIFALGAMRVASEKGSPLSHRRCRTKAGSRAGSSRRVGRAALVGGIRRSNNLMKTDAAWPLWFDKWITSVTKRRTHLEAHQTPPQWPPEFSDRDWKLQNLQTPDCVLLRAKRDSHEEVAQRCTHVQLDPSCTHSSWSICSGRKRWT